MRHKSCVSLLVALLCAALLLSGCSGIKLRRDPPPAPTPEFHMKDLEGVYTEESAHKGVLKLTATDDTSASIVVDWPSSSAQNSHWEMDGTYDAEKGVISYTGASLVEEIYDPQGGKTETHVYTDGTGSFAVDSGKLSWTDDKSLIKGEPSVFAYEMSLADYARQVAVTPSPSPTPIPTPSPTPVPTQSPAATPVPAATPAATDAKLPRVTKSPTDETVEVGGSCYFLAKYENALWAVWHFVSPDGTQDLTYEEMQKKFPDMEILNGMYSQVQLKKIPLELNGWKAYCEYSNHDGAVKTNSATIHVVEKKESDLPRVTKSPVSETVQEGGSCYFTAKYENALWAVWHFVSPDGSTDITYEDAQKRFTKTEILNGMYSQMQLKNITLDLNGWKVYCEYSNRSGATKTNTATITVTAAPAGTVVNDNTVTNPTTPAATPVPTVAPGQGSIIIDFGG